MCQMPLSLPCYVKVAFNLQPRSFQVGSAREGTFDLTAIHVLRSATYVFQCTYLPSRGLMFGLLMLGPCAWFVVKL